MRSISPYLVRMRENVDQSNSEYGHCSRRAGFIHGLRHRYTYLMRTIPGISHLLKPLDDATDTFIKVLLQGCPFNPNECVLFSLPVK